MLFDFQFCGVYLFSVGVVTPKQHKFVAQIAGLNIVSLLFALPLCGAPREPRVFGEYKFSVLVGGELAQVFLHLLILYGGFFLR